VNLQSKGSTVKFHHFPFFFEPALYLSVEWVGKKNSSLKSYGERGEFLALNCLSILADSSVPEMEKVKKDIPKWKLELKFETEEKLRDFVKRFKEEFGYVWGIYPTQMAFYSAGVIFFAADSEFFLKDLLQMVQEKFPGVTGEISPIPRANAN
jgi:hypothetical protein